MLDVLHLFVAAAGHNWLLYSLVLAADGSAHVANVTVLVVLVATTFLLLDIRMLLLQRLLNELVFKDTSLLLLAPVQLC